MNNNLASPSVIWLLNQRTLRHSPVVDREYARAASTRGSAIDCSVRNLSEAGAALDVATPVGIPEKFTLVIPSDNLRVRCSVVYRKENRIGVAFD